MVSLFTRQMARAMVSQVTRRAASVAGSSASSEQHQQQQHLSAFEQTVGNTRLVRLKHASEVTGCDILAKAEYENPGGSVKDRAALQMIREAEEAGILKRGSPGIIVEGTAGNTGIGLALAGAVFGYDVVIVLADTQSEEKKQLLRWAGARVVEVPAVPFKNPGHFVHVAARVAGLLQDHHQSNTHGSNSPTNVFLANQWDNLGNRRAHLLGTGPEIWQQTGGAIDAFSCAMGTGGTLSGVAEYLRSVNPDIDIVLTDPCGAAVKAFFETGTLASCGGSISEGIGQGRITGNMEGFRPDYCFEIPDEEMLPVLHDIQKYDGLAVGGSAGINVAGAMRVAKHLGPGHRVVTVLCDLAGRYSQKLYNPAFLLSKGLPSPPWLEGGTDRQPNGSNILNDKAQLQQLVDEAINHGGTPD